MFLVFSSTMFIISILLRVQASAPITLAHRSQSVLRSVIQRSNVLVVGDGDFSFSKVLANRREYKSLTTSTLDDEASLTMHFPAAGTNIKSILSASTSTSPSRVDYGVDATKIHAVYPSKQLFDVIIWNFPHITGKANIYYNRELLHQFLASARQCLTPHGLVICTLCEGQSGVELNSVDDWSKSWKLPVQASEAGMRLVHSEPFDLETYQKLGYRHKGHRGFGGAFRVGESRVYYVSGTPSCGSSSAPISYGSTPSVIESLALSPSIAAPIFVHEVHVYLPPGVDLQNFLVIVEESAQRACSAIADEHSFSDSYWSCHLVDLYKCPFKQEVTVAFQVGYSSTSFPLSRDQADKARVVFEVELPKKLNLVPRNEKHGNQVSKGYPHTVANLLRGYQPDSSEFLVPVTESVISARPEEDKDIARLRIIGKDLWRRRAGVIANGFSDESYSFKDV